MAEVCRHLRRLGSQAGQARSAVRRIDEDEGRPERGRACRAPCPETSTSSAPATARPPWRDLPTCAPSCRGQAVDRPACRHRAARPARSGPVRLGHHWPASAASSPARADSPVVGARRRDRPADVRVSAPVRPASRSAGARCLLLTSRCTPTSRSRGRPPSRFGRRAGILVAHGAACRCWRMIEVRLADPVGPRPPPSPARSSRPSRPPTRCADSRPRWSSSAEGVVGQVRQGVRRDGSGPRPVKPRSSIELGDPPPRPARSAGVAVVVADHVEALRGRSCSHRLGVATRSSGRRGPSPAAAARRRGRRRSGSTARRRRSRARRAPRRPPPRSPRTGGWTSWA